MIEIEIEKEYYDLSRMIEIDFMILFFFKKYIFIYILFIFIFISFKIK